MRISIEAHTLARAEERGATLAEVREVIESGTDAPAKGSRLAKAKVFRFESERGGRWYPEKRVLVVYVVDGDSVATVTVYVYYGKWD